MPDSSNKHPRLLLIQRLETLLCAVLIILAPGLWDAAEYSVGTLGKKMHKYHNHPDLRPQVAWSDWTAWDSFVSGISVSWFLVLPTLLLVSLIYLNKLSILSHFHNDLVVRLRARAMRWLRLYTVFFTILPFAIYLGYIGLVDHPFAQLPLADVSRESVAAIDGDLLFVHLLYYLHGAVFAVLGLVLSVMVHGRE